MENHFEQNQGFSPKADSSKQVADPQFSGTLIFVLVGGWAGYFNIIVNTIHRT